MFYPRLIYPKLSNHLKEPETTVLTGMRRTGKTMLLKKLFDDIPSNNKILLDLENRSNHLLFNILDYDEILKQIIKQYHLSPTEQIFIFLDEIQNLKNLPSVMKYLSDHYKVKFVATGSSSFYLKNLFSESMAGRKRIFELFPLTFSEFLVFNQKINHLPDEDFDILEIEKSDWWQEDKTHLYRQYLLWGGFPKVVLADTEEKKRQALDEVLFSYIDQDVKNLSSFKKISHMEDLIRLLAARVGQKIDISKLSRECGLARETIEEYLEFLERTYFIFRITPFSRSVDREITRAKKLYFCDTGFANYLGRISHGQALENAVFQNLKVKVRKNFAFDEIKYYQLKNGREIDFIINDQVGVEVKETVDIYDLKRLKSLTGKIGLKEERLISMNKTKEDKAIYASQI